MTALNRFFAKLRERFAHNQQEAQAIEELIAEYKVGVAAEQKASRQRAKERAKKWLEEAPERNRRFAEWQKTHWNKDGDHE